MDRTHGKAVAPLRVRLVFWMLMGTLSVLFAEVVACSTPFPFFEPWGALVVVPLYSLHILVLAPLAFRRGAVRLTSLWLAGAIFGLYEAYVTKILWHPTWFQDDYPWVVGGVYVVHTALLVLFWHAFMAFMIPVFIAENLFTGSSETIQALPGPLSASFRPAAGCLLATLALAVFCGMHQSNSAPGVSITVWSDLSTVGVLFLLAALWRRMGDRYGYTLRELLPSGRSWAVLAGFLAFGYLWQTAGIHPEFLPRRPGPHLTILGLYALFGGLLMASVRVAGPFVPTGPSMLRAVAWQAGLIFLVVFPAVTVLFLSVRGPNRAVCASRDMGQRSAGRPRAARGGRGRRGAARARQDTEGVGRLKIRKFTLVHTSAERGTVATRTKSVHDPAKRPACDLIGLPQSKSR